MVDLSVEGCCWLCGWDASLPWCCVCGLRSNCGVLTTVLGLTRFWGGAELALDVVVLRCADDAQTF